MFVLILAGLLVDGGLTIHARQRAADIAEQAARAAADTVDKPYLRQTGKARIVHAAPCRRARLLAAKYPEVKPARSCATPPTVSPHASSWRIHVKFQLLSAFGFPDMTMSSSASAHPQEGIYPPPPQRGPTQRSDQVEVRGSPTGHPAGHPARSPRARRRCPRPVAGGPLPIRTRARPFRSGVRSRAALAPEAAVPLRCPGVLRGSRRAGLGQRRRAGDGVTGRSRRRVAGRMGRVPLPAPRSHT